MKTRFISILAVGLFVIGCHSSINDDGEEVESSLQLMKGTVSKVDLGSGEGPWSIISDSKSYEICCGSIVPKKYFKEGLEVYVQFTIRYDVMSVWMSGRQIKIYHIVAVDEVDNAEN